MRKELAAISRDRWASCLALGVAAAIGCSLAAGCGAVGPAPQAEEPSRPESTSDEIASLTHEYANTSECRANDADTCLEEYERITAIEDEESKDPRKPIKYSSRQMATYLAGCYELDTRTLSAEARSGRQCGMAAWGFESGTGVAKDRARALELYKRACEMRDWFSCKSAANLILGPNATWDDEIEARSWYQKGCEQGDSEACNLEMCARGESCYLLGAGILEGNDSIPENLRKAPGIAVVLLAKACRWDEWRACRRLGLESLESNVLTRNESRARRLFERACDLAPGNGGCTHLGIYLLNSSGAANDLRRAIDLLSEECAAKEKMACHNMGVAYLIGLEPRDENGAVVEKNNKRAAELLRQACSLNYEPSCQLASEL